MQQIDTSQWISQIQEAIDAIKQAKGILIIAGAGLCNFPFGDNSP